MNIGKKKIKQIEELSLSDEMLREYGHNFMDEPPDEWHNDPPLRCRLLQKWFGIEIHNSIIVLQLIFTIAYIVSVTLLFQRHGFMEI